MEYDEGSIAEDGAGNFMVFRYGAWHPSDEAGRPRGPIDASAQWGPGARELPNGTVERVGPQGGVSVVAQAGTGDDGVGKLTEGQGKAMLYGGMMAGAERDYQAARAGGYNPASLRNTAANVAGIIPFDGDFFGRLIRDDVSDAGRQAELRWAEGNLRQLTGAAATNPEIARVAAINFDRGNDELADQRYRTRAETYQGTRYAAGPGSAVLPAYPGDPANVALPAYTGPVAENLPEVRRAEDGRLYTIAASNDVRPDETEEDLIAQGYRREGDRWVRYISPGTLPPDAGTSGPVVDPQGSGIGQQAIENADREARARLPGPVRAVADLYRNVEAFSQGAAERIPGLDEAAAWAAAKLAGVSYDEAREVQGAVSDYDRENYGLARNVGGVTGAVAPLAVGAGAPLRLVAGATRGGRALNAAAGAGAFGAAVGAGEGDGGLVERSGNALIGGGLGAAVGPVAQPVANALGRTVVRPVTELVQGGGRWAGRQLTNALGGLAPTALREATEANPLATAVRRFADRSPQEGNALLTEAQRFRAEDIAPTFADVVNDGGRGTMRALATRQTPARQAAREFADGRAAGLQDRLSAQSRRTISDDPRQPAQIREEITTRRNALADRQFGAVRGDRVSPDRDIIEALRTPAMRPAIEEAATSAANRGDMETAQMLRDLAGDALDYGADAQMTVGMADRIARSLNGRADAFQRAGNNDAAASHFAIAERLRGGARQQVPGYDEALNAYAQDSGLAAATELGEQFMSMEADAFASAVSRLSPEEQTIARAAARRAVERQAGTQGQAPGVAQRLANGREQATRTTALLGDAEPVQRAMGTELQTLRNAQGINPAQGSPTSMNAQDAMGAAGAARDVVTGNVPGLLARTINAVRARGFNDAEAQALVEAAIDPTRTDELVGMLAQRMNRREARNLARAIRHQIATGPQSGQQPQ